MAISEFKTYMSAIVTTVAKGIVAFRRIFLTYVIVLSISGLVYAVFSVYPSINAIFADSRSTPWGIVTSIFAHSSLEHITANMANLFVLMFLFSLCNSTMPSENKRKIESFFLISSFGFAIVSNILWLFVASNPSVGASGLVYATEGNLVGFSLFNGLQFLNFAKLKTQKLLPILIVTMNLLVSVSFLLQIFLNPAIFLSVGEGVNIVAHGISFLSGFIASILWCQLLGKVSIFE